MALATGVVAGLPLFVVLELRAHGVISSPWAAIPLAVVLSLLASLVGSEYWKRHHGSGDVMFSELLLWGWLRRLYIDHQVRNATRRLGLARGAKNALAAESTGGQSMRLLRRLAVALDAQDTYTERHSRRVARHATMVARKLRLGRDQVAKIQAAALVHDVGKLYVPRQILHKPSKLDLAEFTVVKRHPEIGAELVACLRDDELTAIVRHHHERLDGSGYPDGLSGDEIPLGARIVAVVDMFDAITAPRPYRPAQPHRKAFSTLAQEAGTHLDPEVVDAFRSCYSGRGPLAWWLAITALLERVAWPQDAAAARMRPSPREVLTTTATTVAIAAVAVAAPIAPGPRTPGGGPSSSPQTAIPRGSIPQGHTARSTRARHPRTRASAGSHVPLRGGARARTRPTAPTITPIIHVNAPGRPPTRTPPPTRGKPRSPSPPASPPTTTPAAPTSTGSSPPSTATSPTPTSTTSPTPAPTPPSTTTSNPPTGTTPASPPTMPVSKDQCRGGGYAQYGFSNQGQCIAYVEHASH